MENVVARWLCEPFRGMTSVHQTSCLKDASCLMSGSCCQTRSSPSFPMKRSSRFRFQLNQTFLERCTVPRSCLPYSGRFSRSLRLIGAASEKSVV